MKCFEWSAARSLQCPKCRIQPARSRAKAQRIQSCLLNESCMRRVLTVGYRLACIGTLISLAFLSLLPAGSVNRTELGGPGEHLLAYVGTALVFGIGARQRTHLPLLLTLIAYAGLLEFLQMFAPGRTSHVSDFLYSAAGLIVGLFITRVLQRLLRGKRPQPPTTRGIA